MKEKFRILVLTAPFLEEILKEEIEEVLGHDEGREITLTKGCLSFQGGWQDVVHLNLQLRTATRVLVGLTEARVKDLEDIYKMALQIPWETLFTLENTFAVTASVHDAQKMVTQDLMVGLKIKDAIADRFRSKTNRRPNVDRKSPDMRIFAKLTRDFLELSLDTTGEALSHRGYRVQSHAAPMREVLAAALIRLSGWNKVVGHVFKAAGDDDKASLATFDRVKDAGTGGQEGEKRRLPAEIPLVPLFLDPMCGSGTIPIEAALVLKGSFPAAQRRSFPFLEILPAKAWKGNGKGIKEIYQEKRQGLLQAERDPKSIREKVIPYLDRCHVTVGPKTSQFIIGKDFSGESVRTARSNAAAAGVDELISWREENFFHQVDQGPGGGLMVMNPPYGKRLGVDEEGDDEKMIDFYRGLGDTFKRHFPGWITWVFSGNEMAIKRIGLRATRRYDFMNGQVKCRFHQFIIV